ncbi:MAG: enoyl-CoA hydratase/isomerase family protein [Pseudomonadales bacterium]
MGERVTVPVNDPQAPVLLFEHQTPSGHVLAEARLNVEATLNSLSLPMIDILRPALDRWADDDAVAGILLTGAGERAFSAGGDIQALYRAMVRNHEAGAIVDDYPDRFFEHEYRLDYRIHTYPKPVISVGHGVVMGGGLGIFSGARHRVVTEKSRIALPEVTIGLFPDAGATWLLRNMPAHVATFIATTGAHVNGADAVAVGVATHAVAAAERDRIREGLLHLSWTGVTATDHDRVRDCLDSVAAAAPATLPEAQAAALPASLSPAGEALDVAERVRALAGTSPWVDGGIATMNRGCPTSVGIAVQQLQRAGAMSLADTFRMELIVATHCARHRDFAEGVRALIIDKDNRPQWQFGRLEDLPADYVAEHFTAPWPANPLADLEGA